MITIWGRGSSANVQKVMWALAELNLQYRHVIVGGPYGGTTSEEFKSLNPVGKIPVLKDDNITLWESHAILRYLSRKHGGHLSVREIDQPFVDQWLDFTATYLFPPFVGLFWQLVRTRPSDRSQEFIARHTNDLGVALDIIDEQLGKSGWLATNTFTIADIAAGVTMERCLEIIDLHQNRPNLTRWHGKLAAREAYKTVVATSYEELRAK